MPIGKLYSISSPQPIRALSASNNDATSSSGNTVKSPLSKAVSSVSSASRNDYLYSTCKLNKWGNAFEGFAALTKKNNSINPGRPFSSNVVIIAPKIVSKAAVNKQPAANQEVRSRIQEPLINASSSSAGESKVDSVTAQSLPDMRRRSDTGWLATIQEEHESSLHENVTPSEKSLDSAIFVLTKQQNERKNFLESMLLSSDDGIVVDEEDDSIYYPAQECVCAEQNHTADAEQVTYLRDELKEAIGGSVMQSDSAYGSTEDLSNVGGNVNKSSQRSPDEKIVMKKNDTSMAVDSAFSSRSTAPDAYFAPISPDAGYPRSQSAVPLSKDGANEKILSIDRSVVGKRTRIDDQPTNKGMVEDDWDTQDDVNNLHLKRGMAEKVNIENTRDILSDWLQTQFKFIPRRM